MKYNKWTVALAAIGVVSFASAAKAEEKASPVMTALSGTTISGYVDTSAEWNPGTGNANLPPYKFNSPQKADGFNLDVIQLRIDKPLDEQDWAAGYRADLWFGPDANTLGTSSRGFGNANSDFGIRQAYVALRAPVGTGLDFKMGVFDSIIGYESIEAGNNPNFTRSYGHSIEPQTETGLLASYRFCDCFSASVGIADSFGPTINDRTSAPVNFPNSAGAESYKSYMGSLALTAPDSWGFLSGSTLYAGAVNGFVDANATSPRTVTSYYLGATVATPVTGLRTGASFDYIDIHQANNDDYSLATYGKVFTPESVIDHDKLFTLKLVRRPDVEFLYPRIEIDARKDLAQPVQIRYFNDAGAKVKTETRSEFTCHERVCIPKVVVMVDHTRADITTTMTLKDWKLNRGVPDSFFTVRALQRGE